MNNSENRRIGGIGWAVIAMSVAILFTCGFLTALVGIVDGLFEIVDSPSTTTRGVDVEKVAKTLL